MYLHKCIYVSLHRSAGAGASAGAVAGASAGAGAGAGAGASASASASPSTYNLAGAVHKFALASRNATWPPFSELRGRSSDTL